MTSMWEEVVYPQNINKVISMMAHEQIVSATFLKTQLVYFPSLGTLKLKRLSPQVFALFLISVIPSIAVI